MLHLSTASVAYVLFGGDRRWLRGDGGADPDGLDVDEFSDAEGREFAAIAAAFDAAEGEARVGGRHAVDEDAARFEMAGEGAPARNIACPQVAAQPKVRVVRQFYGVVGVAG